MAMYLDDYLDSIALLPFEVKRNFDLMRELDQASHEITLDLKDTQKDYLTKAKTIAMEGKASGKSEAEIRRMIDEQEIFQDFKEKRHMAIQKLDEKIAIATQTYDLVDHHIRRLDEELAKFEEVLKQTGEFDEETEEEPALKKRKLQQTPEIISDEDKLPAVISSSAAGRKKSVTLDEVKNTAAIIPPTPMLLTEEQQVDPQEPLYCHCQRVSYGQMVGCDNDDCKFEWFHFECVGLSEQPKGTWYCADCRKKMKK